MPLTKPSLVGLCLSGALLAGCAGPPPSPASVPDGDAGIAVIKRDWHTEIGLSLDQVSGPLAALDPPSGGERYLVVGFGNRDYFTDPDAGFGEAFAALFSGPAAIQLVTFKALPAGPNISTVRIRLSRRAIDRIVAFIWDGLAGSGTGTPVPIARHAEGDLFFAARADYDGLYNCNSWIADALKSGGLPFEPSGTLFASDVMDRARQVAALQAARSAGTPAPPRTAAPP